MTAILDFLPIDLIGYPQLGPTADFLSLCLNSRVLHRLMDEMTKKLGDHREKERERENDSAELMNARLLALLLSLVDRKSSLPLISAPPP